MECNLNRRLTVTEIAAHVGLHRSYFSGLFNQIVGMPPLKYLIQLRLNKACDLMRYPNATPLNVANSLGLDPSALFRYFKRNFGMTPSQYQRSTLDAARRADEPKIQVACRALPPGIDGLPSPAKAPLCQALSLIAFPCLLFAKLKRPQTAGLQFGGAFQT